jgi:hypothetical protein
VGMKKIILLGVVLLIVIEVFFRLFYPQSEYSVTYAKWGWRHIPNTVCKFYGEEPRFGWGQRAVEVKYNARGLRCADWSVFDFRDVDIKCILLLGDSWLEDMGSPYNNLVHIWLNKKIEGYTINAGHYGFDNAQELMWYLKEGKKYSPDIVIVFYANDKANPENAMIEDGKLVLKWREFTHKQKVYRNVASWIRLHTHFGSWLLTRIQRIGPIGGYMVREGLKEPPNPVVGPKTPLYESGFRLIDKMIYQRLAAEVEKDNATLVMLKCMGDWSNEQKAFFKDSGIYHMYIPTEWPEEGDEERIWDKAVNNYDPSKESHRFSYMQNERVAQRIIEYLKVEGLI